MAKQHRVSTLVSITKILTNGNEWAMRNMASLAANPRAFFAQHKDWCTDFLAYTDLGDNHAIMLHTMVAWLTGYATEHFAPPCRFGLQIVSGDRGSELADTINEALTNLGHSISMDDYFDIDDDDDFWESETVTDSIEALDAYFHPNGYTWLRVHCTFEGYCMFIIKQDDLEHVIRLGQEIGFTFTYDTY